MAGVVLMFAVAGWAQSQIPDLVGAWKVTAEGGVLLKGAGEGPKTPHRGAFSTMTAEWVVTKQQGRVFHGTITSQWGGSERFICVISPDNKNFHCADEDGFVDGKIVDRDKIETVYRHATAVDTVVAVGVISRQRDMTLPAR